MTEHKNLFITGATGSGKTYLTCAFSMEACKQRYKTKYVRLPDMLLELDMARADGTYKKALAKYANPVLLIIDEWLLLKPTEGNSTTFWNCSTEGGRNHPPSSVRSMNRMAGTISWEAMTALWLGLSWVVSNMMPTRSISYLWIPPTTAP